MCEDKNRTANENTELRENGGEFQIFRQLPEENWDPSEFCSFSKLVYRCLSEFSLLLPLCFINHCCLSYSAPIAAVALCKIGTLDSLWHSCWQWQWQQVSEMQNMAARVGNSRVFHWEYGLFKLVSCINTFFFCVHRRCMKILISSPVKMFVRRLRKHNC